MINDVRKNNEIYLDLKDQVLINNDCFEVLKKLPDNSVDLIVIDPPYNMKIRGNKWDSFKSKKAYIIFMENVFKEAKRVLKINGNFYFFHMDMIYISKFITFLTEELDMLYRDFIVWNKPNFMTYAWKNPGEANILQKFFNVNEYILRFTHQEVNTKQLANVQNYKLTREYLRGTFDKCSKDQQDKIRDISGNMFSHWFSLDTCQFTKINKIKYEQIKIVSKLFNLEYEDIDKMFDNERKTYRSDLKAFNDLYKPQHYTGPNHNNVWQADGTKYILKDHPTSKPVEIITRIIETSTKENDVVLDFFNGSGSTMLAALNTSRKYIGVEINETYCELTKYRVNARTH